MINKIAEKVDFREKYPNISSLTDYINRQNHPGLFMRALFSMVQKDMGRPAVHGDVEPYQGVRA